MHATKQQNSHSRADFVFIEVSPTRSTTRLSPLCGLTVEAIQAGMRALAECRADGWEDALTVHEVYYRMRETLDTVSRVDVPYDPKFDNGAASVPR
jgi:hypothetical protein